MKSDLPQIVNATSSIAPLSSPSKGISVAPAEATKALFYRNVAKA
jgi:hypothetical protein